MNSSKVLPFNDWFKIYERAERDFDKTQMLIESERLTHFTKLFEANVPQTGISIPGELTVEKGQSVGAGLVAYIDSFGDTLSITAAENGLIYEKAIRLSQLVPNLAASFGGSFKKVAAAYYKLDIFKLVIAGIGNSTNNNNLADTLITDPSLLTSLGINVNYDTEFSVPAKDGKALINKALNSDGTFKEDAPSKGATASTLNVCAYLNTVNLINWSIGNFKQYVKLTGEKYGISADGSTPVLNLSGWYGSGTIEDFTKVESDRLYLFTNSKTEGEPPANQPTSQPTTPSAGKGVWINFAPDNYSYDDDGEDVTGEDSKAIKQLIKQISAELGENGTITKMKLNWTGPTMYQGTKLTGTGTGVSGSAPDYSKYGPDTYLKDKSPAAGQWLNYFRAYQIADNLEDYLGPRIKKGGIDFTWNLADLDSTQDSNLTYSIVSKADSPTALQDTATFSSITKGTATLSSTGTSNNIETTKIYRYVITFDSGSIDKNIDSKLKKVIGVGKSTYSYDSVEAGDIIKYKGLVDKKISDKVVKTGTVISKDEDGITLKDDISKNRIVIKRERYISGEKVRRDDASTGF